MSKNGAIPRLAELTLSDRFTKRHGRILITGVQALVRLMLVQSERDRRVGLRTGGFVSGYRGSPLGTLDVAFAGAGRLPDEAGIVVQPAVNEELAATAIAGTQQLARSPGAKAEGVFSLWYGKGPGLDRAADAIRHGNMQGAAPHGGVVLAVGDDHVAKSSSIVCYSDETVASLQVPLFYPADPREIVLYGLHAFALSRHTGSWSALKIITEVADSSRAVAADELDIPIILPDIDRPAMGLHNAWPETPLDQELKQQNYRLPAVLDYVRANELDRAVGKGDKTRVGLIAAGKSWLDLLEGLRLLGLDEADLERLGIALYKPALIWPLEPEGFKDFARGLRTIVVVEEKGAFIESQIKAILYGGVEAPQVLGKTDGSGQKLFPKTADLAPELIATKLAPILAGETGEASLAAAGEGPAGDLNTLAAFALPPMVRKPFFCSGCPHNRSTTVLPDGSRAMAGIGCHGLAAYNQQGTETFAQMGGEGIHWMGVAPFTDEPHIFVNIGDGTYFHSGVLAIRQSVAAGRNITYKILYNSAVAMTGGQKVDGELSVERLIEQVRAEGVARIVICTDDPGRYPSGHAARARADLIAHRDELDRVQRDLRATPGVTVLVYEQMCATEKRRMRKRGKLADPTTRVFINERVCEDCGDCSTVSNCLSIEPMASDFETKRRINQSSCNKDYSCLNGFCPSFVTVENARIRKPDRAAGIDEIQIPHPVFDGGDGGRHRVLVAGIGGTGVVTTGALLSMAAHMEGRETAVLDQVGMAQKGGAVTSHIHVSDEPIAALRIPVGQANLVIACDQVVGNARDVIAAINPGRGYVVANADVSVTGDFTRNRAVRPNGAGLTHRLAARAGKGRFAVLPFTRLAEALFGDAIASNLMMVGFAFQKGWLRLDLETFFAAIELNGTGVAINRRAFAWGRRLVLDPRAVFEAANLHDSEPETLDQQIERRAAFLRDYQDGAYADRYRVRIARLRVVEERISSTTSVTEAAAQALFRLMAYKDEYEVARLYADGAFARSLAAQFEGPVKVSFLLAPPVFGGRDKVTGLARKRRFGRWMLPVFKGLSRLKGLRGTAFDPFGYTGERRAERALITEFEGILDRLAENLSPETLELAAQLAGLPLMVRGYGAIKERAIKDYHVLLTDLLDTLDSGRFALRGGKPAEVPGIGREDTVSS